jgi:hypothetical protein
MTSWLLGESESRLRNLDELIVNRERERRVFERGAIACPKIKLTSTTATGRIKQYLHWESRVPDLLKRHWRQVKGFWVVRKA